MKAYKALIKHALSQGCTVSVYDGEAWAERKSTAYNAIVAAVESVEEAELIIRDAEGNKVAWAMVHPFGADAETIVDNTCTPFMDAFDSIYA